MPITETGCWIWLDYIYPSGYGVFKPVDGDRLAHRVSWKIYNGPIPKGKCVCHKCDINSCVNPSHLFIGTHKDNSEDMTRKKRQAYGEKNGAAKLTELDVTRIRKSYSQGGETYRTLGEKYKTAHSNIGRIVTGKLWRLLCIE